MRPFTLALSLLLLLGACGQEQGTVDPGPDELVRWMTGSFSSGAQAAEDPDYHEILLHMARIWPEREDGCWLYVEQALGRLPERPYRQRVYHVVATEDGRFASHVFELPDSESAIGAWKAEAPLGDLGPDVLGRREGCTVFLERRSDGSYADSTKDDACKSDFQGATYATSEVTVREDEVVSWGRGYDADGNQVWGAVKAGYVFKKTADHPLRR